MKKSIYLLAGAMAMMAVGCSESSDPIETQIPEEEVKPVPMSIGADVAETRMNYERTDENRAINVTWSASDEIQLYKASNNTNTVAFTLQSSNGTSAVFETENVTPLDPNTGDDITAIYPASSSAISESVEGNVITKKIAMKDQTIKADGEGDSSVDLMVARTTWQGTDTSLAFTRLMGSIVLDLNFDEDTQVEHIVLTAAGEGFNNYGEITLDANGGYEFGNLSQGPMSATVEDYTASQSFTGQVFFIPGTYSNIVVTVITDRGHFTNTRAGTDVTLEKNKNYRLQVGSGDWDVAPLYTWTPPEELDLYATTPGYNKMKEAGDAPELYFLGDKDEFTPCVWSNGSQQIKFTLTDQSSDWAVFMGDDLSDFTFYPEYKNPYIPSWDDQDLLRLNVVTGEIRTYNRFKIYYVGDPSPNEWDDNSSNGSNYLLTCDIDNKNRIDEFTVKGLEFDEVNDQIKFPTRDYDDVWNSIFIKAKSKDIADTEIRDGVTHDFVFGYANYDAIDYKFTLWDDNEKGIYNITINVIDETITFNKQ